MEKDNIKVGQSLTFIPRDPFKTVHGSQTIEVLEVGEVFTVRLEDGQELEVFADELLNKVMQCIS